jgi:hypothetical protein
LYWASFGAIDALSCRTITHRRTPIVPSSIIAFMRSIVASGEPASSNVVIPFDSTSFDASSSSCRARASRSSGVGAGSPAPRLTSPCARSRISPVASPFASRRISPPGGASVGRRMPDSSIALPLANAAWPLACTSRTGLFGDTLSSDACVGNPSTFGFGRDVHFSWCQPRP